MNSRELITCGACARNPLLINMIFAANINKLKTILPKELVILIPSFQSMGFRPVASSSSELARNSGAGAHIPLLY